MKIGVARVSTRDQHPEAQEDALRAAGCEQVFTDKASGKLARRPGLEKALLIAREDDQLVVTKLDRLGRSLEHLIELSKELQSRGVDLVVLDQGIETSSSVGRLFFSIIAAILEFEHALMSERTMDGLAAARARGRTGAFSAGPFREFPHHDQPDHAYRNQDDHPSRPPGRTRPHLGLPAQQTTLPGQPQALHPGPRRQLPDQLLIRTAAGSAEVSIITTVTGAPPVSEVTPLRLQSP